MKDVNIINEEIKSLGKIDSFGTKKEIAFLPEVLNEDENIKALTSGFLDGNTWLIVCTNKRIVFLDKGMIFGLKQVEIPIDKINSIGQKRGLILGEIHIQDGASNRKIESVSKETIAPFIEAVNKEIENYKNSLRGNSNQTQANTSVADEIIKLKSLVDAGVLTQEEFDTKKRQLLGM